MGSLAPEDLSRRLVRSLDPLLLQPWRAARALRAPAPRRVRGVARVCVWRGSTGSGGFPSSSRSRPSPRTAHSDEFERIFLDEASIAASMHHPNITETYELGEEGHVLYLVMEWVNGESLRHVVHGSSRSVQPNGHRELAPGRAHRRRGVRRAALRARVGRRDRASAQRRAPRCLPAQHPRLARGGMVKMTDFGVAKALGYSQQATVAGQMKGKVAYMAPEVIDANAYHRQSTAILAMGCVLYEAATGTLPFQGCNDLVDHAGRNSRQLRPSLGRRRRLPAELAAVIARALVSDPRQRFATAEQSVALEEWLAKSGLLVTPAHVGHLVRERLGAHLDQRGDHARAGIGPQALPHLARHFAVKLAHAVVVIGRAHGQDRHGEERAVVARIDATEREQLRVGDAQRRPVGLEVPPGDCGSKASLPAGTGVCVVKMFPALLASAATAKLT